jgi:undecaprenyl-diphosphatase
VRGAPAAGVPRTGRRSGPGWVPPALEPLLERRTLLAVLAVAALAWAFAGLHDAVREGGAPDLDHKILLLLRDPADPAKPWGPGWLQTSVRDVTALGGTTIVLPLTLLVAGYLALVRKRGAALFLLAAILGAVALGALLKLGFERPRPDLVEHGVLTYTWSFPSGHATGAAATYLTLGALLARFQPRRRVKVYILSVAVLITVAVGLSRIYLGVHWPTDVLAGWTVGAGWALLCWTVVRVLQRRGNVEPASEVAGEEGLVLVREGDEGVKRAPSPPAGAAAPAAPRPRSP